MYVHSKYEVCAHGRMPYGTSPPPPVLAPQPLLLTPHHTTHHRCRCRRQRGETGDGTALIGYLPTSRTALPVNGNVHRTVPEETHQTCNCAAFSVQAILHRMVFEEISQSMMDIRYGGGGRLERATSLDSDRKIIQTEQQKKRKSGPIFLYYRIPTSNG